MCLWDYSQEYGRTAVIIKPQGVAYLQIIKAQAVVHSYTLWQRVRISLTDYFDMEKTKIYNHIPSML